jgi:hypothetical protein
MGEAKRRKQAWNGADRAYWRTRLDAADEAYFGVAEVHAVFYQPNSDRGGRGQAVTVNIPETPDAKVTEALAMAGRINARLVFLCDTRDQAEAVAERADAVLPTHRRVAYERAEAGAWGLPG